MVTLLTKSSALGCHCITPTARDENRSLSRHSHLWEFRANVKRKRIKENSCQGAKRGPWEQQAHIGSSGGVDRILNSPVQPFKHLCGIICPGFGQDGIFPIPQKRWRWEPSPSRRPAREEDLRPCAVTSVSPRLEGLLPSFRWPPGGRLGPQTASLG